MCQSFSNQKAKTSFQGHQRRTRNVNNCYIVSALNNTLPPVIIFPRVHFKLHIIEEAPAETLGLATPSGWINSEFVKTMQYCIVHSNNSKDNPILLIYDNHESHKIMTPGNICAGKKDLYFLCHLFKISSGNICDHVNKVRFRQKGSVLGNI